MSKECTSGVLKAWEVTMRKTQAAKKRANNLFGGAMSVAHADDDDNNISSSSKKNDNDDDDNNNGEVYTADTALSNGDYYTGHWFDNFPHGHGKYIWTDGCSYVGEWDRGKTMGKGRFSWPNGATYEGEFKTGYMDGKGTYIGSNHTDTYKGFWVMNLRHGHGLKSYINGDYYEGEWRKGLQDGLGKYQWSNGDNYIGEWKHGVIYGFGKFVWINGNSFDGYWEDGFPKGNGTFSWSDGSCYKGVWNKADHNLQKGAFYPSEATSSEEGHREWDPRDLFNIYLNDCQICQEEKVPVLPSQKKLAVWRSSKGVNMGGRPRRVSIDGRASVGIVDRSVDRMRMIEGDPICGGNDDDGGGNYSPMAEFDAGERGKFGQPIKIPKVVKRQGELIRKGHKNYELMLNLQLGIRHSVGRPAPIASLDLKASAFDPKEKVWTKFPPTGSKHTPPHQSCEFKWKDYCPVVFRTLRKLFKVDAADYMLSICGNDALRELSSPGKSGSFFYLTNDDRYMIKTMKKSEVKVLIRMLSSYYNHFRSFENTLVAKFYGLHCVKLTGQLQKKVRFIIMGNLFCSEYAIHRRYDLKGSSLGRFTDRPLGDCDATTILKDLDLNFIFRLQKSWFQDFRRQIDRDCEFLEQERIMDYSLLVGLHFVESSAHTPSLPSGACTPTENEPDALAISNTDQLLQDPSRWSSIRLGLNMPATAETTVKRNDSEGELIGEPTGEYYDVVMFFGIIDILQDYDISKKLEHAYKSMQYDSTSISAVDPRQYSRRFRDFICSSFVEDT